MANDNSKIPNRTLPHPEEIGCVLLAAGNSRRFRGNKLTAEINGKPLIEYALKAIPSDKLSSVVTVTQYEEAAALSAAFGFSCIRNDRPGEGLSRSVRLGLEALSSQCGAVLFMAADQPLLTRKSVAGLIDFYRGNPNHIVSASSGTQRGNPCIFPKKYFPSLAALTGDNGGSVVIRAHTEDLLLFPVSPHELLDADTPEALDRIRSLLS